MAVVVSTAGATAPGRNGLIAFTRYQGTTGAIYTLQADGSGTRQVTRPPAGVTDFQPDWSPDGSRIVFERQYPSGPYAVFSVRPDGSGVQQLDPGCPPGIPNDQICEETAPAWSPDGKQIAFNNAYGKIKMIRGVRGSR